MPEDSPPPEDDTGEDSRDEKPPVTQAGDTENHDDTSQNGEDTERGEEDRVGGDERTGGSRNRSGEESQPSTAAEDAATSDAEAGEEASSTEPESVRGPEPGDGVPDDVRTYDRFTKMDGAQYERVNDFLRNRTYITAREWAIARLCADFRTETGVEMTKIGQNLPSLVPFMTDTYSPQAVNQARASFEEKVRKSGATFLYGAMSDFFTADELDEMMYEATEVAKFLLEVEGVDLTVEEELEAEERISSVMRDVRHSSEELRHDGVTCPNCGHEFGVHEGTDDQSGSDAVNETDSLAPESDAEANDSGGSTPPNSESGE